MGKALEIITGFVTAPDTTATALTMATGDSNTVKNADLASDVLLLQAWADVQGDGEFRIRSPKLHDAVQGIRLDTHISDLNPLLPKTFRQPLVPQDTLTLDLTGSATGGDIETAVVMIFYGDLPGIAAKLIDPDTLLSRMVNVFTVENTIALGTAGGYSGEEAINAEFDQWKANQDYALIGYLVSDECACVGWRASDSGNLRVGGPGDEDGRHYTRSWFVDLSKAFGMPLIPVFNAANKASILIDGATDENGTDTTVTSIFAELSPGPLPT